jgi:hypothetical protein
MYDPEHPDVPRQDAQRSIPPETSRQDALGQLRRDRWFAQDAGETALVAEIDLKIQRLSAASSPTPPQRETTSATTPRERRATPPRRK